MKTDIEIAKEAKMLPITEIAHKLGIEDDELELYGKYKAKINDAFLKRTADRKNGKLILCAFCNCRGKRLISRFVSDENIFIT